MGCPPVDEGQQIFLPFLSPREGRPLGSLPWLSMVLYWEPLTSLHRGRVGSGIFQAGLTFTPKTGGG